MGDVSAGYIAYCWMRSDKRSCTSVLQLRATLKSDRRGTAADFLAIRACEVAEALVKVTP